jgi:predicted permease
MQALFRDIRYGFRFLRRHPGFTLIAAGTLALAIGANTAAFSLIHAVLIRPLPYKDPEQLMALFGKFRIPPEEMGSLQLTPTTPGVRGLFFNALRQQKEVFQHVARFQDQDVNLTRIGPPERIRVANVSTSFFPLLGVSPELGRTFAAGEDRRGNNRVVITSHNFWRRRLGGDPGALGKTVTVDKESYMVVGVMPADFQFPLGSELWMPLVLDTMPIGERFSLPVVARLQPGITREKAQANIDVLLTQMQAQRPVQDRYEVGIRQLHDELVKNARHSLIVLLGAVALVLLIGCANIANLLLARAAAREREIAIRAALGASRARVCWQLLTESMLLALLGGTLGLAVAVGGVKLLLALLPADVSGQIVGLGQAGLHPSVLGFATVVSLLTGIVFGLAPALASSRWNLNELLKSGTGNPMGRSGIRNLLVVTELALALALLIGAGLMMKSLYRLQAVPLGFNPKNVLTMDLSLDDTNSARRGAMVQEFVQQIESLPGVQSVGVSLYAPFTPFEEVSNVMIKSQPAPISVNVETISPDYPKAVEIPLLRGRGFTWMDQETTEPVILINEKAARQWFPAENPIGQQIRLVDSASTAPLTVAGVLGDIRQGGFETEVKPSIFLPWLRNPAPDLFLAIRAAGKPAQLREAVQKKIRAVHPDQSVFNVQTMEQRLRESVLPRRLIWLVLGTFSILSWVMAILGTYGVMAYAVAQQNREIGIRMALGAQPSAVIGSILKRGLKLIGCGVAAGLIAAFFMTRLLDHFLFQVGSTDGATFAGATLLLGVVALLACYIPAYRASKVDPLVVLRYE